MAEQTYGQVRQSVEAETAKVARDDLTSAINDLLPDEGVIGALLIEMILSLAGLRGAPGMETATELAERVSQSPDLGDEVPRETLASRLGPLLDARAIKLLGQSQDLLSEHAHLMSDVRVLSDIRPLFSPGPSEVIVGAVIGHTMRLNFVVGEPNAIDVSLDVQDLSRLRDVIDRALRKDELLRQMTARSGVTLVVPFESAPNER